MNERMNSNMKYTYKYMIEKAREYIFNAYIKDPRPHAQDDDYVMWVTVIEELTGYRWEDITDDINEELNLPSHITLEYTGPRDGSTIFFDMGILCPASNDLMRVGKLLTVECNFIYNKKKANYCIEVGGEYNDSNGVRLKCIELFYKTIENMNYSYDKIEDIKILRTSTKSVKEILDDQLKHDNIAIHLVTNGNSFIITNDYILLVVNNYNESQINSEPVGIPRFMINKPIFVFNGRIGDIN